MEQRLLESKKRDARWKNHPSENCAFLCVSSSYPGSGRSEGKIWKKITRALERRAPERRSEWPERGRSAAPDCCPERYSERRSGNFWSANLHRISKKIKEKQKKSVKILRCAHTGSTRNECNHLEAMYRAEFSMQILGSYRKSKPKDEQIDW